MSQRGGFPAASPVTTEDLLLRPSASLSILLLSATPLMTGCHGAQRDNVVFILVDALRADHVGVYGRGGNITPNIDELARTSRVYVNAYSVSTWTVPSVASLFTGTLPVVHRIDRPPSMGNAFAVLADEYVLANEVFAKEGYRTGMVTTIGWVSPNANYDQGVDEFIRTERSDWILVDRAKEFITRHRDERFHLYLHFIDMHDYYDPKRILLRKERLDPQSPLLRLEGLGADASYRMLGGELERPGALSAADVEALTTAYDRGVRETDMHIGRIVGHLKSLGLLDDTLIVVTSDHGEQFMEHGALTHAGEDFYNEVLHIPLIIAGPSRFEHREEITTPVSTIDIFPTLFSMLGIETPPPFQGEAVLENRDDGRAVVATSGKTWKVITRGWSYIVSSDPAREELYDLVKDPQERSNLAHSEEHSRFRNDMRGLVQTRKQESLAHEYLAQVSNLKEEGMSEEEREKLRSLGYIGPTGSGAGSQGARPEKGK